VSFSAIQDLAFGRATARAFIMQDYARDLAFGRTTARAFIMQDYAHARFMRISQGS
jgi:hypothetical protein